VLQAEVKFQKLQAVGLKFTIFAIQGDATRPHVAVREDIAGSTKTFRKG